MDQEGATMIKINVRSANARDYADILALQNDNYIDNVQNAERGNGFLSATMSEAQLDAIANDLGISVAYDAECAETFLGFFCVSRLGHWKTGSIVHRLVNVLQTDFLDRRVNNSDCYCIFGPMCLSASARGKDVLKQLYEHANANLQSCVTTAVGFIAVDNPRSLGAMAKLDWKPIGRFQWGEREYHALIRDIVDSID